jgi:DNA polymerase IV
VKTSDFKFVSHQDKLDYATDNTRHIYQVSKKLYNDLWKDVPVRQVSVRLTSLTDMKGVQMDFFENDRNREPCLDRCIDGIRKKYGDSSLMRASLLNSGIDPVMVPVHKDYPKIKPNIFNGV